MYSIAAYSISDTNDWLVVVHRQVQSVYGRMFSSKLGNNSEPHNVVYERKFIKASSC